MRKTNIVVAQRPAGTMRALLVVCLALGEMLAITSLYAFDARGSNAFRQVALLCVSAATAFIVLGWGKRDVHLASLMSALASREWRLPLAFNIVSFAALTLSTVALSRDGPSAGRVLIALQCLALAATALSVLGLAAPAAFWRQLLVRGWREIVLSLGIGLTVMLAERIAQQEWYAFADMTLSAAAAILSTYEHQVWVDYDEYRLGVGDFEVQIAQSCSGYEGMALVTAFLVLYLWAFRRSLRFPQALLLLPIGIIAVWLLNALRIALLVTLGTHLSPDVAVGGFHAQAGWVGFLVATVGIMALAPRLAPFGADPSPAARSANERTMLAFLAPFLALMAANIVVALWAPYDAWLHLLKPAAVGLVLWKFRGDYARLRAKPDALVLAAGAIVGVAWVVGAPFGTQGSIAAFMATEPASLAALWLAVRAVGATFTTPIAEELAFRGLLYRWLISRRFESVSFAQFSWLAFIVSSVAFGLLHQRWLEGTFAGAVFALVMVRRGRLSDAIAAHMTANALVLIWAITARQWALL
jgi:exosortase E/protease (VPEID-CTERM system)